MVRKRILMTIFGSATLVLAGWDFVPEGSWNSFGTARSRAMGSVWWTDSTHFGLWALDANPAGLVGSSGSPFSAEIATSGTSLSGGGGELSHTEPIHLEIGSGKADGYAFQAHLVDVSEAWRDTVGKPEYDLSRLRWGFDAAVSLADNRALVFGIGLDGRYPGSQTQDTSGTRAQGTFEHLQLALEALRLGFTSRIMESVTIGLQGSVRADFDSLQFSSNAYSGNTDPQLRFARIDLPEIGAGVSVDRADWPLQGTVLFDWGRGYQIGVLKDQPQGVNVDLPQLTTDSLRFALAVQGRPDTRIPDQVFRPSFAVHWTSSSTQAYVPTEGTNNPLSHGSELPDSSWTVRRTGLVLGMEWSWLDRIHAQIEGELVLEGITAKNGLYTPGATGDTNFSTTDSRIGLGVELAHTLIPAWREAIPKEDGFCLRLGMQYQVLGGLGLEPGWFTDLNAGREPPYSAAPSLAQLGMAPSLGRHAQELSWTGGLGGWILDKKLQADMAFSWNTWTPTSRTAESGAGWDVQLRYSM
jgi:hypothetical protein